VYGSVSHSCNIDPFSPQLQDDLDPCALDTKTPLPAEDDSGALNLDPYNLQAMFENPNATKPWWEVLLKSWTTVQFNYAESL